MSEMSCGIVNIVDRKSVDLTGIHAVDSFDEYSISLSVNCGKLVVEGENLTITVLDLDKGIVSASGIITSVSYYENSVAANSKLFSKLFGNKK